MRETKNYMTFDWERVEAPVVNPSNLSNHKSTASYIIVHFKLQTSDPHPLQTTTDIRYRSYIENKRCTKAELLDHAPDVEITKLMVATARVHLQSGGDSCQSTSPVDGCDRSLPTLWICPISIEFLHAFSYSNKLRQLLDLKLTFFYNIHT